MSFWDIIPAFLWPWGIPQALTDTGIYSPYGGIGEVQAPIPPSDTSGQGDSKAVIPGFLALCAAIGVTATAAPAIYIALKGRKRGKKGKANEATYLALEGASNRVTSLLAGLAPAFAMPIAYIGVQELENKGIITKDLGNAVQSLMVAGVVAPAIGNVIGSVVGSLAKGGKTTVNVI